MPSIEFPRMTINACLTSNCIILQQKKATFPISTMNNLYIKTNTIYTDPINTASPSTYKPLSNTTCNPFQPLLKHFHSVPINVSRLNRQLQCPNCNVCNVGLHIHAVILHSFSPYLSITQNCITPLSYYPA